MPIWHFPRREAARKSLVIVLEGRYMVYLVTSGSKNLRLRRNGFKLRK